MKFHFFTIPIRDFESATQELNDFCGQNRVVTVDKQFVVEGENSFWSFCVAIAEEE